MANDFSKDVTCKALWRFESGALTTDSKGTNTLTAVNTPTADTTYFKDGAASTALAAVSHQFYKITQANLNSGFPWKYGESNLKGTICLWVRPTSLTGVIGLIGTPHSNAYNCVGLYLNSGVVYYQYNKSQISTGKTIDVNHWWHIALVLDGDNKTIHVRVCQDGSNPLSNYDGTNAATLTLGTDEWRVGALAGYDVSYTFQGSIDEVVVFSRLLTDGQIDKVRQGTYGPIDFITSAAAISAASTPNTLIVRPLTSSPVVASSVSNPILAMTTPLQSIMEVGSATATPLLDILRALTASPAGVSDTGVPILAIERPLASSFNAISAVTTPNLAVQRALATLATVISTAPDISLGTLAIYDLVTAIAAQSQVSIPVLKVGRPLNSSTDVQSQVSTIILALLRTLTTETALKTQVADIILKILRGLVTAIAAQTSVSTPVLDLLCLLTTAAHSTTDVSSGVLKVLRDMATIVAAQTVAPDIDMTEGVPRDLITAIAVMIQISEIELTLAFHESLLAKAKRYGPVNPADLLARAKQYYGPINTVDLEMAALEWEREEEKQEKQLPGDQYNG